MSELDACLLARFPGTRPPDWLRTGSSYPGNGALGAVGDTGRRVAASIDAMLAAGGVNLDLAPTADQPSS